MCEAVAPEFFEIGDDGALRVLNSAPAECHRAMIEEAVADCPTGALSIED
jgi:ferredoxin